jgi:hypothetical protein
MVLFAAATRHAQLPVPHDVSQLRPSTSPPHLPQTFFLLERKRPRLER